MHQAWGYPAYPNPGVIAARAGHLQLLGWLVRHCAALLMGEDCMCAIVSAAAQHCDLAGLQVVWAVLDCSGAGAYRPLIDEELLAAAVAASSNRRRGQDRGGICCSRRRSTSRTGRCWWLRLRVAARRCWNGW